MKSLVNTNVITNKATVFPAYNVKIFKKDKIMLQIELTQTTYHLKEGTKTSYQEVEKEESIISEESYKNIIMSSPFFRRLGGSETATRTYTCAGYKVVKLVSKNPDRDIKIVREFKFTDND